MGGLIRIGIVWSALVWTAIANAAPASPAAAKLVEATRLNNAGQYDQALAAIADGLALAPSHTGLLELKGQVLIKLPDYLGALEAYEADVAAGATGSNLRNARVNITALGPVRTTFLDLSVSNGPAVIHLDLRTQRAFCTAEPACRQGWLPGTHKVIAERPGFQTWTGPVTLVAGKTTKLAITLVEKPSALTVHVAQADAVITVDDAPYNPAAPVPGGSHRVVVTLSGHVTSSTEVVAHEGKPVELEVSLVPRVAIRVEPATAALELDGRPIAVDDGGIAVAPGHHALVARAPGMVDGHVDIAADRPADYSIVVVLARPAVVVAGPFPRRRKLALVAGGVSVVAFAAGAILGTQAKQREDDSFKLCPAPEMPCAMAAQATDLNKQGQSRALEANIGYGIAAGAAITGVVLWLTGAPRETREPRVAVTPRLGAIAGLDLHVSF